MTVTPAPDANGNTPAKFPTDGEATQQAKVTASFSAPGRYRIQMGVEASWWSGTSDTWKGKSDVLTMEMNVIKFDKLQYRLNGVGAFTNAPVTPQVLYLPINQNVEFQAVQNPENSPWPSGQPIWSSEGAGLSGASGSGKSKTIRINASGNYSITATCGEYSRQVDIVVPAITFESDRSAVCAGGWSTDHGYQYLPKDPNGTTHPYTERVKPDPHIATMTATAKDGDGNPISGLSVEFKWDMPGDAPAKTETKTTTANGKASVDVTSGDELSKDTDEDTGTTLFDNSVPVTATCLGVKATQDLEIVAPVVQWQYKDDAGNYVAWSGEDADLYSDVRKVIPLRVELRHANLPVTGHSMSWGIEQVLDKAEEEVLPSNAEYSAYGYMSGGASTTTSDGSATATFTRGSLYGQIVFKIEDSNVFTYEPLLAGVASERFASTSLRLIATEIPMSKRKKKSKRKSPKYKEYTWVKGVASYGNKWGYPAPPGEEDGELLQNTLTLVRAQLNPIGAETLTGGLIAGERQPPDRYGDPGNPNGWFFSQIVGNDPDSAGYHFADLRITKAGKTRRFSATFDIVINGVPVFVPAGRRAKFGPYVKALRDKGLVAWHRWAGEDRNGDGNLASVQNELHGIDPAYPFIKSGLDNQIERFKDKGSGGNDYNAEPSDPDDPFTILDNQVTQVKYRETTKRNEYKEIYPEAVAE